MPAPVQKRDADFRFELPDLLAQRRLRVCSRVAARVKFSSSATATK
jgi:hypothetical protein